MPKELREIKHFNAGTILNASEQDIPEDAAAFSLNVNPIAEGGILEAINTDKIVANTDGYLSYFNTPVSWGSRINSSSTGYNDSDIKIDNVNIFENKNNVRLDFTGTKGIKESLNVFEIEPRLEKIFVDGNLTSVSGWADDDEAVSNSSVALTIDDGDGNSPYATSPILKDAFANRRVYDEDGNFHGECTDAVYVDANNSTLTFEGGLSYAVTDNKKLYTKLFLDYTPTAALTATGDYISYNTDTTIVASTDADFVQSFAHTGFSNGVATITLTLDGNIATTVDTNLDGQTFTLTTPDGRIKVYEFESHDTDGVSTLTGTVLGSGNVLIGIGDAGDNAITGTSAIATQIQTAITHSTGHGGRISVTKETNVLTLTYIVTDLSTYLQQGDYLSFVPYMTTFTGRTGFEIMQVQSIDTNNKRIYLNRNCFGTTTSTLAASTTYLIFSNRKTINESQTRTNEGTLQLGGWSDYSGNNINGNSVYLMKGTSVSEKSGRGVFASDAFGTTYSITDKTIVIVHASLTFANTWEFNEGDIITLYQSGTSTNNGYRGKILKQVFSDSNRTVTLTMDTAPSLAETESSDTIYIEGNLLKNHTFHHAVGLTTAYKVNDWIYKHLFHNNGSPASSYQLVKNYYIEYAHDSTQSQDMIARVASGGYWEDTKAGHNDLGTGAGPGPVDLAESYYPFSANDAYISITSEYHEVGNPANSRWEIAVGVGDTRLVTVYNLDGHLASGDIIKSSTEYMRVVSVEGHNLTVERGLYGTTPIAHTAKNASFEIEKSVNPCISQDVPKEYLKGNQTYKLSFYAKAATTTAIGALSIRLNGGYFNSEGKFIEPKIDRSLGILGDSTAATKNPDIISQENRWVEVSSLYKPNGDNNTTLDSVWRLYTMEVRLPNKVSTDLEIEFTSRGPDGTIFHLDLVDFSEHTYVYSVFAEESQVITTGYIDNKSILDLVVYGPKGLGIIENFDGTLKNKAISTPTISNNASANIISNNNDVSIVSRNREAHIGFGGDKGDTAPQWLGYINHTLFGKDYSEELYQDEDTVHSYDDSGLNNINKICLAGEHEYLTAYWNNSGGAIDASAIVTINSLGTTDLPDNRLRINHASHSMNTGDAIVAREWADTDNSWDGSGVWIVTDGDEDDYFDCRRYNTKDPDPVEKGIIATDTNGMNTATGTLTVNCADDHYLKSGDYVIIYGTTSGDFNTGSTAIGPVTRVDADTFTVAHATTTDNEEGTIVKQSRLCYRPYFHYGMKTGENYIYRIWPELRIDESVAEDSTFSAGKIEQSYPLDEGLSSISTCYNKEDDGTGGGRIYGLTTTGKVLVLDMQVRYDNWQKNPLTVWATVEPKYKSYKWSNDHINGKIGGALDVFGDTDSTTPTIIPTGDPSDILETKGTTSDFDLDATSRTTNEPNDFDTRLWIQYKPSGTDTFGEGARFLFCGKSEANNTNSTGEIFMADRSPSMTMLLGYPSFYDIYVGGLNEHTSFYGGPGPCSTRGMYNEPAHGDLDVIAQRKYSYYQFWPLGDTGRDVSNVSPRSEAYFDSTAFNQGLYDSGTIAGRGAPYINFGYNMGWQGHDNTPPSVKVAKFGLFPVADNDRDGVLDGTGVVTANNISLPDTLSTYRKMGPYGELHRRVSSHAVGIIAGSDNNWQRHWGRLGGYTVDERYHGKQYPTNGPDWFTYGEDAPSSMKSDKFAFICADMHYGDLPTNHKYSISATAGVTGGEANSHSIDTLSDNAGDVIQAGDLIYHKIATTSNNYILDASPKDNITFSGQGYDWVAYAASGTFTVDTQDAPLWYPQLLEGAGDTDAGEQGFQLDPAYTTAFINGGIYIVTIDMKNNHSDPRTAVGVSIQGGTKALVQDQTEGTSLAAGVVDQADWNSDSKIYQATCTAGSSGPVLLTYAQNFTPDWEVFSIEINEIYNSNTKRVGPVTKVNSSTQVTSYNPYEIDALGFILPFSVEEFTPQTYYRLGLSNETARGSLNHDVDEQHFHWAYDKDDPLNGSIFTEGQGCGHYTRTFYTAPSAWGYSPTIAASSFLNTYYTPPRLPGIINRVEKLNFRSGFMIRPFETPENTFEDLIVGSGIYVDMPSAPDAVYHVNNDAGSNDYLHYHVNDDAINNQFASKMIIAAPKAADEQEDLATKVYICDMNFMYPDPGCLIPTDAYSGDTADAWPDSSIYNGTDNNSGEVCYAGLVTGYTTTSGSGDGLENAGTNPVVITAGTTNALHNTDILGASSLYRDQGHPATTDDRFSMLAGLCISVIDQTYGTIQTRYIVATTSHGIAADSNFYFHVHYPFGHAPVSGDKFYLWRHESACTAPIRLFKERELRTGLGSALTADPTLSQVIYKDTGSISAAGSGSLVTVTTTVNHNLTSNDKVTISDTTSYDGPYTIIVTDPNIFTFVHTASTTETGTWTLLDSSNSKESVSNPLTLGLNKITGKTMFGGLDMRKLRNQTITTVATTGATEQRLTASTNHLLSTGDVVTFVNTDDAPQSGTYNIDKNDATTFDITNIDVSTYSGKTYALTTNQWETLVIESGNKASIGELRHGLNSWDRGDIQDNIIRNDSTAESGLYMNVSSSNVSITAGSVGDEDGDLFLKNTKYQYKISLMYDGYQEGPLSASHWEFIDTAKTRSKLIINIALKEYSRRLTHICLYRRNGVTDFFKLVKQIPTSGGWAEKDGILSKEIADTGVLFGTYSSRTGLFETLDTIKLKYGISTEIDGYLFAGKCSHDNIKNASNLIFRSKPGMFSIFDYSKDFLTLKSNPTAIVNYLGRLYIFDSNNIYRINPHTLVIEDTFEGIGCLSQDSVVVTEQGMFFADINGAYFHDGQRPTKISIPIQKGGDTSVSFGGTDNLKDLSWVAISNSVESFKPKVIYDGEFNCVCFLFTIDDYFNRTINGGITENQLVSKSYIWAYNITLKRWDLWELCSNSFVGKPFVSKNGSTCIPVDNSIYELAKGSNKRKYTWLSKKMNITFDSSLKVFKKIKVNGLSENLTLDGSYNESSDRLLISTSKGIITSSDISYTAVDVNDADYKLSGSNKRGKWLQFKLEDMGGSLDSVGVVFRTKPIK